MKKYFIIASIVFIVGCSQSPIPTPKFIKGDVVVTVVGNNLAQVIVVVCKPAYERCSYLLRIDGIKTVYYDEFEINFIEGEKNEN